MNYDIIVIGSKSGGYVTAIRASQLGFKNGYHRKRKSRWYLFKLVYSYQSITEVCSSF
ncbi:MAG: hypothetical protein U0T78_04075 [Cloacibacterium normanense]